MKKVLAAVRCCLLACFMPFAGVAQDEEGKINGSVKDPDGAVVAGASVSLLHSHRAVIAATTTDAEGRFTLEHVSPGDYQLNVEGKGFVRYRSAVHVTARGTQDVAVVLEVTPLTEQVTITAEAGLVTDT